MNRSAVIQTLIITLVVGLMLINYFSKHNKLKNEQRYTIGTVYGFNKTGRGGTDILFKFTVNAKEYKGSRISPFTRDERLELLDKKFIVKFYPKNPKINGIEFNKMLTDSLLKPPPQGWKEVPIKQEIYK